MIAFVVAMKKEAEPFLSQITDIKTEVLAGKPVYTGKFLNKNFALIISGIGKVSSALATQAIIDKFNPQIVINFGTAGGTKNSGLTPGDQVLISKVCQYDFDLSEIDDVQIGYHQDYNTIYFKTAHNLYNGNQFKLKTGASADRFTSKPEFLTIINNLNANVVDMEAGSIAMVCCSNNMPFVSLKLITDVSGCDANIYVDYKTNVKQICNQLPNALQELVSNLHMK